MLRIDDHGRVRLLTLNRPEALNAFTTKLYDATREALEAAAADPAVAVAVLTGEGKAFSAGQDLAEMGGLGSESRDGKPHGFAPFISTVATFPKPLLAAVNGVGVGIGCTVLPHCDIVLISETARLRAPFASLGVVPEAASSVTFPQAMGWQAAAEFLFTSDWLTAQQAVELGLARRTCPPESLLDETLALAQRIAAMPITSLVETKRLMLQGRGDMQPVLDREFAQFVHMVGAPANKEAIAAFLEKREPDFSNL